MSILQLVIQRASFLNPLVFSFTTSIVFLGCSCFPPTSTSETIFYVGQIRIEGDSIVDTSINIYFHQSDSLILFNNNGVLDKIFVPNHPDQNGRFVVEGTTKSHNGCETPGYWEAGALEIYISHPSLRPFHDTISVEQLKSLPKISFAEAGLVSKDDDLGVWVLPEINLSKR